MEFEERAFENLIDELEEAGVGGAYFKLFDQYQGYYLTVPEVDTFWVSDTYSTGQVSAEDRAKPYISAELYDPETQSSYSPHRGDFFDLRPDDELEGLILILTKASGETVEIDNPKVSDLPDITDVRSTFAYEKGTPVTTVFSIIGESTKATFDVKFNEEAEVVDAGEFVEFCLRK